ncbi:MAG: J domain-containing protein [Bdellovibrionota bacterium]
MLTNANFSCRCTESLAVKRPRFSLHRGFSFHRLLLTATFFLSVSQLAFLAQPAAAQDDPAPNAAESATPSSVDASASGASESQGTLFTPLGEKIKSVQSGETPVSDLVSDLISGAEADTLSAVELRYLASTLPTVGAKLSGPLLERLPVFLANVSVEKSRGFLSLVTAVYTEKSPVFTEVRRQIDLARQADELVSAGKRDDLLKLAASVTKPGEKTIVSSRLSKLLAQGDPGGQTPFESLKKLGEVAKLTADPQVTASAVKLITELESQARAGSLDFDGWTLDDPAVKAVVRAAEQSSPDVKLTMASLLDLRIRHMLSTGKAEKVTDSYLELLEARPDPNTANDDLRLFSVLNAEGDDARQFAMGRLEELRYSNKLGTIGLLRVFLKGYYGKGGPIFLVSSVIIVLLVLAFMLIRPFFIAGVSEAIAHSEERRSEPRGGPTNAYAGGPGGPADRARAGKMPGGHMPPHMQQPQKKSFFKKNDKPVSGYARGPVEEDEYTKLLGILGLDDSASEGQIKKAYRAKVKNLHPDTKPGQETEDQEFIELKEVYDRILQIRGSWFGGKR